MTIKKKMAQVLKQMKSVEALDSGDPENTHGMADDLLLKALIALTSGNRSPYGATVDKLIKSYNEVSKWYA